MVAEMCFSNFLWSRNVQKKTGAGLNLDQNDLVKLAHPTYSNS